MDDMREVEALAEFEGRGPGTDAERRAAVHLERRLRELGREAEVEPIEVRPNWPLAHAIHGLAAIVGSVVAVSTPVAGVAVLAVVAVSALGDLTGAFHLARRLTGWRASQNVVSEEDSGRPGTLVLVAHYDAGRTGAVFGPRALRRRARVGRLLRRPVGPFQPFFLAIAVVLACAILRLVGVDPSAVAVVQFAATVALIVSVPLLADVALSGVVPGANDNASGVATVLRLAERYGGSLDHFDVWVVLTGAQEAFAQGARAFARSRRRRLDSETTVFLCVDEVGAGTVRWIGREGPLVARPHHHELLAICERIADEDAADEDRYGARSILSRSIGDAHQVRAAGFAAASVTCRNELDYAPRHHQPDDVPENVDPDALDRAFGFCSELVELVDEEVGPRL